MAVSQTGAIYKSLFFDGEDSRDYGVYITGEAVYNAPERAVEMISIPGRNGQLALDGRRFENIEVTYPAGIFADTEADFAEAISNFRNLLCSRRGYVRLQDEYNPNEYRLAIYKSGLEVDNALHRAGEFDIVFDCKPQRFLTSGETAIEVDSGDVISNPTLFDASPLLEVEGYGDIDVGGREISVNNVPIGEIIVSNRTSFRLSLPYKPLTINLLNVFLNNGDEIKIDDGYGISIDTFLNDWKCASGTITSASASVISGDFDSIDTDIFSTVAELKFSLKTLTFTFGTASTETAQVSMTVVGTSIGTTTRTITISVAYDGAYTITVTYSETFVSGLTPSGYGGAYVSKITANSSASALGNPLYIDLDIGEAWNEDSGTPVSVNNAVTISATLPKLTPGANTITFDNTITDLKVIPRWWKI